MIVVGIDPGTACGWAMVGAGSLIACGTWDLKPNRHEGGGMRYLRFRRYLDQLLEGGTPAGRPIGAVFYEEVRRHQGVDAAHIYGGIVAALSALCEERKIPYRGVSVATVKRIATGKGGGPLTGKERMLAAARAKFPAAEIPDDNTADAIFVALAGLRELSA